MSRRIVVHTQKSAFLAVDTYFLSTLMRPHLSMIDVDEDWYLSRYPDIEPAITSGTIANPAEHYVMFGYFEHRMPYRIEVDEVWYLMHNDDVRLAVSEGVFPSAQGHFDEIGFREGRSPHPDFRLRLHTDRRVEYDA